MNLHEIFTQPHLPQVVMTNHDPSHPIKRNAYKPSYLGQILMDFHNIFSIGPQWAKRHEGNLNLTQPHLPKMVMTYNHHSHPIKTNSYKPSNHGQLFMDLHKMFTIGSQWGNKHKLNLKLIPPHLAQVVMTYHDHSHPFETNTPLFDSVNSTQLTHLN